MAKGKSLDEDATSRHILHFGSWLRCAAVLHYFAIASVNGGRSNLFTSLLIFAATLLFILWRPREIREVWFALAGAVVMLIAGLVDWSDVRSLWLETGTVLLFLAGMLVVGFLADQAGLFGWLAYHTTRLSRGSGVRLYAGLYLIGVLVTVWFSLDTTAVVLAPIVYSIVQALGLPPLPFVLATTYVANTASLLLPVSNLTNLIVWNKFAIPFWEYAAVMAFPAVLAVTVNLLLFLWLFRRDIPKRFSLGPLNAGGAMETNEGEGEEAAAMEAVEQTAAGRLTGRLLRNMLILAAILLGLAAAPFFGWEIWVVAVLGALVMLGAELAARDVQLRKLASGISWDLLPFVFSLFLILRGVGKSGLTELAQTVLLGSGTGQSFSELLTIAVASALGSNLINNLPMILVAADSLSGPLLSGQIGIPALYAALLGTNLGPNLTVIGSLATMLSLSIIGKKGLRVSGLYYLKVGILSVPLLLGAAVFGLWVTFRFFS